MFSKLKPKSVQLSDQQSKSKIPPTQITPQLYLSGLSGKSNYNLEKYNIDLIINATNEVQLSEYKAKKGKQFHEIRIPVDDKAEEDLSIYFKPLCEFIEANEDRGGSTLIHCFGGRSRSVTFIIAYLLWKNENNSQNKLQETLDFVKQKRPIVKPNEAFMKQLKDWENELEKKKCTNNVSKPLTNLQKDTLKSIDELTQHFRSQRILCRFCCPEHPARLSVETIV